MISPNQLWNSPPGDLELSENEVHVWRASLNVPLAVIQNLQLSLTTDEATKAKRFHFEKHRNHFIVARGLLRTILSRYLDIDPHQLRFCYNAYGKPSLDLPYSEKKGPGLYHEADGLALGPGRPQGSPLLYHEARVLNFNLSHSHELALYAFTYSRQVGIDIEYMRANVEYEELAQRFFSPDENAILHALPEAFKQEAFFNCWTRKEAYIKARGKGLSIPLESFDVSLRPGEPAALLNSREDPQEATRWELLELAPGHGYAGALAVEGSGWHLHCWQWDESG